MATVSFRGELLLTQDELNDYNKRLEKACLEIYGLGSGFVPWRFSSVDQPIRTHTPSSISLATALRELDATADPSVILTQTLNRRSSYKHEPSPPPPAPPTPPPVVELKNEPKTRVVHEKIEYNTDSDFYKLLHPSEDVLKRLPLWARSIHNVVKDLCYSAHIKPFLKYFKNKDKQDSEVMDFDKTEPSKSDKLDDLDFDDLNDDLHDILMDIDETDKNKRDPSDKPDKSHSSDSKSKNVVKFELGSLDNSLEDETDSTPLKDSYDSNGLDSKNFQNNTHLNENELKNDSNNEQIDLNNKVDNVTGIKDLSDPKTLKNDNKTEDFNEETSENDTTNITNQNSKETLDIELILQNLLDNKYDNSSKVLSLLYMFFVEQFRSLIPGTEEWMCAQDISVDLNELRLKKGLNDSEKLHGFKEELPPEPFLNYHQEVTQLSDKKQRTSMDDFEHELSLINNTNEYTPTISLPEVKNITDDERMEFYENVTSLDQEYHLELFTVFEHAAVWKLVGNGEIELDDQNTDPKIYRGMIKWVKEKRNNGTNLLQDQSLQFKQISQIVI